MSIDLTELLTGRKNKLMKFMDGFFTSKRKRKENALILHGIKRSKATDKRRKQNKVRYKTQRAQNLRGQNNSRRRRKRGQ